MTSPGCSSGQITQMHHFYSKHFCHVQATAAPQGTIHVHSTGCGFVNPGVSVSGLPFFFSSRAFSSEDSDYYVLLVLKRKPLWSVMCIMTPLSL